MAQTSKNRRWLWVGLFVGLWAVLVLLSSVQAYVSQRIWDHPISWELAFRRSFKEWFAYGLLSAGVLWLCGRVRLRPGGAKPWALAHLGAAVLFSFAYLALYSWLVAGEVSVQTGKILTFSYLFKEMAVDCFIMNLMIYWLVVLAHSGWHFYRHYREHEVVTAELQREQVEAKLEALRMQLNPHFLFNTLHAVSALIHE